MWRLILSLGHAGKEILKLESLPDPKKEYPSSVRANQARLNGEKS